MKVCEMKTLGLALGLAMMLAGCSKSGEGDKPSTEAASTSAAAPKSSAPSSASARGPESTATGQAATYSGSYSVAPGKIYISEAKDYAGVKQAKDDPAKHVGDGTLSLTVDAEGRVAGTIDTGPASPAVIDGRLSGSDLRGSIRRKTPTDDGLTGTLDAKVTGDAIEGKLSLAEATAAIVRDGKLSLKRK